MKTKHLVIALISVFLLGGVVGIALWETYERELSAISVRVRTLGPMRVIHVADGDTIRVQGWLGYGKQWSLRLRGPDTAEVASSRRRTDAQCFALEAKQETERLVTRYPYANLKYEWGKRTTDDYGRPVVYVQLYSNWFTYWIPWVGLDLNYHLIRNGFADHWAFEGRYSRYDEFEAAEQAARAENLGGWKECGEAFNRHDGRRPVRRKKK